MAVSWRHVVGLQLPPRKTSYADVDDVDFCALMADFLIFWLIEQVLEFPDEEELLPSGLCSIFAVPFEAPALKLFCRYGWW